MDEATLWRLAEVGIVRLPPARLAGLIQWCWERCEISADARFCAIARALEPVSQLFDDNEESGGVAIDFSQIDEALRVGLPDILGEPDKEAASLLARCVRKSGDC